MVKKTRVVFSLILIVVFTVLSGPFVTLAVLSPISDVVAKIAHVLLILTSGYLALQFLGVIFIWLGKKVKATESSFDDVIVPIAKTAGIILIVISTIVALGKPFGVNFSGLLTGLGIGGMALALASKDTLGNFFGAVCLICDRPFDIGHWIKTSSGICGYVRKIGLRSTNIETDDGSIVSIPNGTLASLTIENFEYQRPTP